MSANTFTRWPAKQIACYPVARSCSVRDMIIVVANSKGGVGKSTIAAHLTAWLHQQGHQVVLADCDTQHSSSDWLHEALPEIKTVRLGSPDQILDELPQIAREADFVIADGPGSNTETSRTLLLCADLAIVPCKASMLEVRALKQATLALQHAHRIRRGKPKAVIVLSMVGKNYRLTQDMRDAAAMLRLPVAKIALTLRQVYADAPGQGVVVWQLGARAREASRQIQQLFRELLPEAQKAHAKPKNKTKPSSQVKPSKTAIA
jgi:chromosome partitioning protein